jgi:WD40 repeat protein
VCGNGGAYVWSPEGGVKRLALPSDDDGAAISSGAFSADGGRVAIASRSVRIYNTATGTQESVIPASAQSVAFSPDGRRMVTRDDFTIRVWNTATGAEERVIKNVAEYVGRWMPRYRSSDRRVAFAADSRRVMVVCSSSVLFWDPECATTNPTSMSWDNYLIVAALFKGNQARIATAGNSGTVRVWGEDSEEQSSLYGMTGREVNGSFSPDCSRAIAVDSRGESLIWDLDTDCEVARLKTGFYENVAPVMWPDLSMVAVPSEGNGVRIWRRRRPEYWWGLAWLPEFWLAAAFAGALMWSVWRDRRTL